MNKPISEMTPREIHQAMAEDRQAALAKRPQHTCGGMGQPIASNYDRGWYNCRKCGKDFRGESR